MGRQERAVKLSKLQAIQILFDVWLVCWILSWIYDIPALFWASLIAFLVLAAAVLCWGTIKIKRRK